MRYAGDPVGMQRRLRFVTVNVCLAPSPTVGVILIEFGQIAAVMYPYARVSALPRRTKMLERAG